MEAPNPKHEIRNSKNSPMTKRHLVFVFVIGTFGFEFVSDFDIRISNLANGNLVINDICA
jgi:hypothetical protein